MLSGVSHRTVGNMKLTGPRFPILPHPLHGTRRDLIRRGDRGWVVEETAFGHTVRALHRERPREDGTTGVVTVRTVGECVVVGWETDPLPHRDVYPLVRMIAG